VHKTVNVPLSRIVANPFRLDACPIHEHKVEALLGSLDRNGFWPTLIARQVAGRYEIAFGHHRLAAYRRKYGEKAEMPLIVKGLTDEAMLHAMADENSADFGTDAAVDQATVKAVIVAYAQGKIQLPKPKDKAGSLRYAPSFLRNKKDPAGKPYTATSLAQWLGWTQPDGQANLRLRNALSALEAVEEKLLDPEDVQGLTGGQAAALAAEGRDIVNSHVLAGQASGSPQHAARLEAKGRAKARAAAKTSPRNSGRKRPRSGKGAGPGSAKRTFGIICGTPSTRTARCHRWRRRFA
jgi:ParB-like chromosome segregation protein Spo0J